MKALKSTIDKELITLANTLGIAYLDWDNLATAADLKSEADPILVGRLETTAHEGCANVRIGHFRVGVKVTEDAGNYELLAILGAAENYFQIQNQIPIRDYTGTVASEAQLGTITISSLAVEENHQDAAINLRFLVVGFVAVIF